MHLKARGVVRANPGDGRVVEVDWDLSFEERTWYFYTFLETVWKVEPATSEYKRMLVDFIWKDEPQDYELFLARWREWKGQPAPAEALAHDEHQEPYTIDDACEGLFLEEGRVQSLLRLLDRKKNVILQGPPGVGKTFLARRLAWAFLGARDADRLEFVQFHQAYSYEDFVQGYRPTEDGQSSSGFALQDGIFHRFCQRAEGDLDRRHVFLIDEINRGNLSRIFGELLMLIEPDKRGPDHAIPLTYRRIGDLHFSVPDNVHVIGMMNLADRSLALVDYALRRRFAFADLEPAFDSAGFKSWLRDRSISAELRERIVVRLSDLNEQIASDSRLGAGFRIGHSFFCPPKTAAGPWDESWYRSVVEDEVAPLLREYWYDDLEAASSAVERLLES